MANDSGYTPVSEGADDIVQRYFTILKRGVYGIWQIVSKRYLHRYVAAAELRYNTRGMTNGA